MTPPPDDIDALVATIHELATDPHYNRNGKSGCNAVMQQCACDCNWQELVIDVLHEAADELARLRRIVERKPIETAPRMRSCILMEEGGAALLLLSL